VSVVERRRANELAFGCGGKGRYYDFPSPSFDQELIRLTGDYSGCLLCVVEVLPSGGLSFLRSKPLKRTVSPVVGRGSCARVRVQSGRGGWNEERGFEDVGDLECLRLAQVACWQRTAAASRG
jgi:hypothetical protein